MLYNGVLVSAVEQCESAVSRHISPPLEPPIPPLRLSQSTELSSPCHIAAFHWLLIYTRQCMYVSAPFSVPPTLSFLLLCPQVCYLCLHLYSCPVDRLFSSVTQSCLTFCDPMDCSMPGLPVHHQLPESTQTHVH